MSNNLVWSGSGCKTGTWLERMRKACEEARGSQEIWNAQFYDIRGMFLVAVCYAAGYFVLIPSDNRHVWIAAEVSFEEVNAIPEMPANWDLPFLSCIKAAC